MAATIKDVAKTLGMTSRGVRFRVNVLDDLIRPHLRSSAGGQTVLTGQAIAILRQLEELRLADALSVTQAASALRVRASQVIATSQPGEKTSGPSRRMSGWAAG